MKKVLCLVMALMILAPVVLLAEEMAQSEGTVAIAPQEKMLTTLHQEMEKPGCPCPCCQKGECKCCQMCSKKGGMRHKMCPMMGKPSMEMAQDGSVVVLIGNKLLKYDANLTLVKEVEIKMPEMTAGQCPMMGMMEKAKEETKEEAKKAKLAEDLIARPV